LVDERIASLAAPRDDKTMRKQGSRAMAMAMGRASE